MKSILLLIAMVISASAQATAPSFVECIYPGLGIDYVSVAVDREIDSKNYQLILEVAYPSGEVDVFKPKASKATLENSVYKNTLMVVADNALKEIEPYSFSKIVFSINGDKGSLHGVISGPDGTPKVKSYENQLSCKWVR
ncbi:MAG: hypothetical protein CME64_15750 [Halobacteriovoraceae bacterium]|nr:hypothetical protein [Halobacteriovoraceae bacterium]|tara:strand:+ start:157 stop:576 length:420 start_codon:yes stop_codon:yes gene_type:complete